MQNASILRGLDYYTISHPIPLITMKTNLLLFFFLCLSVTTFGQTDNKLVSISKEVIQEFTENKFDKIHDRFDERMQDALSKEQLKEAWEKLTAQAGSFQKITDVKTQQVGTYQTVNNMSAFEKGTFNIQIAYNSEEKISGLFFMPAEQ